MNRKKRIAERNNRIQDRITVHKLKQLTYDTPKPIKERRKKALKDAIRKGDAVQAEIMRHLMGWCANQDLIIVDGKKIKCVLSWQTKEREYIKDMRQMIDDIRTRREN